MNAVDTGADRVRRFSRFWTREIGLLQEGLLDMPHSLTEARVIYELGQVPETTATELAQVLDLDPGHLSRVLSGLAASGLVARKRSPDDGRRQLLSLTRARDGRVQGARPPLDRPVLAAARAADAGRPEPPARPPCRRSRRCSARGRSRAGSSCDRRSRASTAGSSRATAPSTRASTASTRASRRSSRRSSPSSPSTTIPRASEPGSPPSTASPSARSSASTPATASRNSAS